VKKTIVVLLVAAAGIWWLAGCESQTPDAATNAKPYPLKTCLVSGEELGKMGEPYRLIYQGQEIRLCCKGCEKDFNKEPEKYLQKIDAAAGK
jgi:hypothetical protein